MDCAMIISYAEKSADFFTDILKSAHINRITTVKTYTEAKRHLSEKDFDLVIINAPLKDGGDCDLARHLAAPGTSQVVLVIKSENYETAFTDCENDGVLVVPKPINKTVFRIALTLAKSAHKRLKNVKAENDRLTQKISDIRIIDRAKCILISLLSMSEKEAHRYIEKQAMDMRAPKRAVAEGILKTYEN